MHLLKESEISHHKKSASLQDGLHHLIEVLKSPEGLESIASISDMSGFGLILKLRGPSEAQMGHIHSRCLCFANLLYKIGFIWNVPYLIAWKTEAFFFSL